MEANRGVRRFEAGGFSGVDTPVTTMTKVSDINVVAAPMDLGRC